MRALLLFVVVAVAVSIVAADSLCSWSISNDLTNLTFSGYSCKTEPNLTMNSTGGYLKYRDSVETIVLSGVKKINDYAFVGFTKLTSITMGKSLREVSNYAFYGCSSLTDVRLDDITELGDYAFYGCSSLTKVVIDSTSLSKIEHHAFEGCTSLKEVNVVEDQTFHWGVTTIEDHAFAGCTSLSKVTLPSFVKTIGPYAFAGCSSLTDLPETPAVKTLPEGVFADCTSLESVSFSLNITTISIKAFQGCTSLKSVAIPATVTQIEEGAFDGCTGLEEVIYRGYTDPSYGNPFTNCENLSVCVPRSYSSESFWDTQVYPNSVDPELDPLIAQENSCYEAVICTPSTGYLLERVNATKWINHYTGCGKPYCDNQTGNHMWSTCYTRGSTTNVCYNNKCTSVQSVYRIRIVAAISGVKYQDFNESVFITTIERLSLIETDVIPEVDKDQNIKNLYLQVSDDDAENLTSRLEEVIKDPNCAAKYDDILCHIEYVRLLNPPVSTADHCSLSLFILVFALIISIFSLN